MNVDMDKIMEASFGEASNRIRATYRKTVNIKQYETEVVEIETELDMGDKKLTGAERMLLSAILQAQLEYTTYANLALKGLVTNTELAQRRQQLVECVQLLKDKAEKLTGKSLDHYFDIQVD